MASKYESYETGDDVDGIVRSTLWCAQTFNPQIGHNLTKVYLYGYKHGAGCGDLTVSIRATSGGKPVNPDLVYVTIPEASLPGSKTWLELIMNTSTLAAAGTLLAIVARTNAAGNYFGWRKDQTSPTYDRGQGYISGNGNDGTWSGAGYDYLFQEWGNPLPAPRSRAIIIC